MALIQELEGITAAVVAAIEEVNRPLGQSIAMLAKGIADEKAAEIAQAILAKADEHCFEEWELRQDMDAMLTREFTLLLVDRYRRPGADWHG